MRRPQGLAGRDHHDLGARPGADVRDPPEPEHVPVRRPAGLGSDAKDLRPIYTAVNAAQAEERLGEFAAKWQAKYPAALRLWCSAWGEFIPFLDYDVKIRRIFCTTNAIEFLKRPLPARGPGPGTLPERPGGTEVLVPGHQVPGPDRTRPRTMGHALEGGVERLRDHLRRTHQPIDELNRQTAVTPSIGHSRSRRPPAPGRRTGSWRGSRRPASRGSR